MVPWALILFGSMIAMMFFGMIFGDKTIMSKKPRVAKKRPDPFYMDYVKGIKKLFKKR